MAELVNMPKLGFDMREGQLVRWQKKVGDAVRKGDALADIESDKATIEVESYVEGVLLQHLVSEGDWVPIGAPIAVVGQPGEAVDLAALGVQGVAAPAESDAGATPSPAAPAPATDGGGAPSGNGHGLPEGVRASPLARRMAREQGLDLTAIPGTGPLGRIVRADVEAYQQALAEEPHPLAPSPSVERGEAIMETPKMRRRIGQRMVESKTTVPHFYVTTEIDIGPALDLRRDLNARLEKEGGKISVNDLIVKAVALALKDFPNLNTSFNGDTLIRHRRINVGIAVAVENGLLNVVSQDADKTPLTVMAKAHAEMIERARTGRVKPEDVEGETIAVSNLGAYDVDHFIAIINPPAAAIVAVGTARQVPVVTADGQLAVGWRMKATVSADHRVTDGAEAAQFLQRVKEILEDPLRLLM